eukprot:6191342-Pleurochrysis_carterae.AAC.2
MCLVKRDADRIVWSCVGLVQYALPRSNLEATCYCRAVLPVGILAPVATHRAILATPKAHLFRMQNSLSNANGVGLYSRRLP